jgi:hypothetical protein
MLTPPSGLNIIWLIKFDNGKLKYPQSVKAQLPPLHQMGVKLLSWQVLYL